MSEWGPLCRFHLSSATRVTAGLTSLQLGVFVVFVALQPAEMRSLFLHGLAAGVATPEALSPARAGLGLWAFLASAAAARRFRPALQGWGLHLPVGTRSQWAGAVLGLASGLPQVSLLWVLGWVGAAFLGETQSWRSLVALPLVVFGAAGSWIAHKPRFPRACSCLAILLAVSASGPALIGALLLLVAAWARSAPAPAAARRRFRLAARLPVGQLVISLRALGWRAVPIYCPGVALASLSRVAVHNNVLPAAQVDLVGRLGASLAVTATVLLMATILVSRRPPWGWSRSLPWSAARRVAADSAALVLAASPFLVLVPFSRFDSGLSIACLLVFLAGRLPDRIRNSLRSQTRLGAWAWYEGFLLALLSSVLPLAGIALGLLVPFVLRASVRRERDLKVGLHLERRFDPAAESAA